MPPRVRNSYGEREGSAICMDGYLHGYATPEQQRLIEQAEHWRYRLIRDGTTLDAGTRLNGLRALSLRSAV